MPISAYGLGIVLGFQVQINPDPDSANHVATVNNSLVVSQSEQLPNKVNVVLRFRRTNTIQFLSMKYR